MDAEAAAMLVDLDELEKLIRPAEDLGHHVSARAIADELEVTETVAARALEQLRARRKALRAAG